MPHVTEVNCCGLEVLSAVNGKASGRDSCLGGYAVEIASRWNVKDDGVGYVTRFAVRSEFMRRYEIHIVGAEHHTEWWIPAEELEELNDNILGKIEVIGEYRKA